MKPASNVILIGSYAPRRCGIATFTQDLRNSLIASRPRLTVEVAAVSEERDAGLHPREVTHVIGETDRAGYFKLADQLNASSAQVVSLQHEYGLFGGPDGGWILDTLRGLRMPVVTTCHTVLAQPTESQRFILGEIGRLSSRMVVMTDRGRELLKDVSGVAPRKIVRIAHGIPDTDPADIDRQALRRGLEWSGHKVILTAGLLSPGKGLEHVIAALPHIVLEHPDAIYVVAGATHPNLVRCEGERYRQRLVELAAALGVSDHVRFINRFVSRDELVRLIIAADVFTTPYLNEAQATSGTLAYAFGLGKPVISTPYWHAAELLDRGRGILVPFASPDAMGDETIALLGDAERMRWMSVQAHAEGRRMAWRNVGLEYLALLDEAAAAGEPGRMLAPGTSSKPAHAHPHAHASLDGLRKLTGFSGISRPAKPARPDDPGHATLGQL